MQIPLDDVEIDKFNYSDFDNVKEPLGRGGEAEVYKVFSQQVDKIVAFKKYKDPLQKDNLKEAKFLIQLSDSENIVKIFGLLTHNSKCVGYVMEYMEYGSLHDGELKLFPTILSLAIHNKGKHLKKGLTYSKDRVFIWMQSIASGIQKLHDAAIIHRDIKPANILLGKSLDDLKISDLGLARDIPDYTIVTEPCGTHYYMAPEILNDGRFNKPGDIYAFAITCWEIIERRPPKELFSDRKVIQSWFKHNQIILSTGERQMLEYLIVRCSMNDPHSRLTIVEILKEVQELIFFELAGKMENYDRSDFKRKEFLALGGQSAVLKAYSERLKRTVALKLYDRSFRKANVREARLLATLSDSEHFVKLHDLINEPFVLVLEYMEMGSLDDAIHSKGYFANKPLTYGLDRVLIFMHNAACGIQRLHELGILHGDIKPGNLLLGKSLDDVKIADFGTATFLSTETNNLSTETFTTSWNENYWQSLIMRDLFGYNDTFQLFGYNDTTTRKCGTFGYLAPEILSQGLDKAYEKLDIFAFAFTCWEILERRPPRGLVTFSNHEMKIRDRPKFEYNHIAVPYELEQLIVQGWDKNPKARPPIEKFVETIRHFLATKTSRLNPVLFQNFLEDFFSKMTKADFEKEMQRFKNYWSDHRVYWDQNKRYYKRAGFIQNIFDKIRQTKSQKEKFSMHIFVPPGFSEKNKAALETTIRHWMTDARNSKKQGSDDKLSFLRVTVEGGDCFAVSAKYSNGVHGNDIIQKILEMPFPGKGASSFPMVKIDRQLYPIPTRTIAVIGSLPAFWEFTRCRQFYNDDRGMTVINGERFNFFKFEPGNTEDVFEDWKKDTTAENKEFHLLCIVENTMDHQVDPAGYPMFEASYSRFREYCKNNKENLALLEFTNEKTKYMLLQDNLSHIGLRLMYNVNQDGENEKDAIMIKLTSAARNAPVVYL